MIIMKYLSLWRQLINKLNVLWMTHDPSQH